MKVFIATVILLLLAVLYVVWAMLLRHVRRERISQLLGADETAMQTDRLVGEFGRAVNLITSESGQVEVSGELWEARTARPTDRIAEGSRICVRGLRSTCLLVEAVG